MVLEQAYEYLYLYGNFPMDLNSPTESQIQAAVIRAVFNGIQASVAEDAGNTVREYWYAQ